MFLVRGSASTFEPAPPGLHAAVCIDVVDLGLVEGPFGTKHRVRLVWSIDKRMPKTGKPYLCQKSYNAVLHPKSTLGKDLGSWRGKGFTDAEIQKGFNLERLVGKGCLLSIQHDERDGTTYANVVAVLPIGDRAQPIMDPEYVRHKDRDQNGGTRKSTGTQHGNPAGEDWSDEDPPPPDEEHAPTVEDSDDIPF